jgi:hypothetical protein
MVINSRCENDKKGNHNWQVRSIWFKEVDMICTNCWKIVSQPKVEQMQHPKPIREGK